MIRLRLLGAGTLLMLSLAGCGPAGAGGGGAPNGTLLFYDACSNCHASDARGTDLGPDLTVQASDMTPDEIVDVILNGAGTMSPLDLTEDEADAVAVYLIETFL